MSTPAPDDPYAPPAAPLENAPPPEPRRWAEFPHDRRAAIVSNMIGAALFALLALALEDVWLPALALAAMYALSVASLFGVRSNPLRPLVLGLTALAVAAMGLVIWVTMARQAGVVAAVIAGTPLMVVLAAPAAAYWWVMLRHSTQ